MVRRSFPQQQTTTLGKRWEGFLPVVRFDAVVQSSRAGQGRIIISRGGGYARRAQRRSGLRSRGPVVVVPSGRARGTTVAQPGEKADAGRLLIEWSMEKMEEPTLLVRVRVPPPLPPQLVHEVGGRPGFDSLPVDGKRGRNTGGAATVVCTSTSSSRDSMRAPELYDLPILLPESEVDWEK